MNDIIFTYGGNVISPSPKIDIQSILTYANNNIIGYTYNITLKGTAINDDASFLGTISSIKNISAILSKNGSILNISNSEDGNLIIAVGGLLKNLTFDSENSHSRFANYSATLSFNELNILGDNFSCNESQITTSNFSSHLLDINQYKIEEFQDNWNFSLKDNAFDFNDENDPDLSLLKVNNVQITAEYTISAKGSSYFNDDSSSVLPWQQAKNFVQDRLFNQIKDFHSKAILHLQNNTACNANLSLSNLHNNNNNGLIKNLPYTTYNESITCSTSESEGKFSATYNAILKFNDEDADFADNKSIHTFNKKINTNYEGSKEIISISIEGTIQGLNTSSFSTDLIFGGFSLPNNGTILKNGNNFDKISNANIVKQKIISNDEDLTPAFKSGLQILPLDGGIFNLDLPECTEIDNNKISPIIFSLTNDYFLGIIKYNAEYSIDRATTIESGNILVFNTIIDVDSPKPIFVELPIVGGDYIIQDLLTTTTQNINITVEGRQKNTDCSQLNIQDIKNIINQFIFPSTENNQFILKQKNIKYNFPKHNFTINASYLCKSGCPV